jgi:hypothetical protein
MRDEGNRLLVHVGKRVEPLIAGQRIGGARAARGQRATHVIPIFCYRRHGGTGRIVEEGDCPSAQLIDASTVAFAEAVLLQV